MKKNSLLLLLISCFLLSGTAFLNAKGLVTTGLAKATDEEKTAFVNKNTKITQTHTTVGGFGKEYKGIDTEAIKKVKKVAIIVFDLNIFAKTASGTSGASGGIVGALADLSLEKMGLKPEEMNKLSADLYNQFKSALEQKGLEILSPEQVIANASYQNLKYEEKEGKVKSTGGGWLRSTYGANNLKSVDAMKIVKPTIFSAAKAMKEGATSMQELGKALGVDAVIVVGNNIMMDMKGKKYVLAYTDPKDVTRSGVEIDIFSSEVPKIIWSGAFKGAVSVPSQEKGTRAGLLGGGAKMYKLEEIAPDLSSAYADLADLLAYKLKMSMESSVPAK